MPIWRVDCEVCGHDESAMGRISSRDANNGLVPCARCGNMTKALPTAPQVRSSERTIRVSGMEFANAKAVDAYAEKHGVEPVSKSSSRVRDMQAEAHKGIEETARKFGYSDADSWRRNFLGNEKAQKEHDRAIQTQQIEDWHKKHGSDNKQTPEEYFGKD